MLVQHVTPRTIDETQDQLLLAGSKITFSDIYNKEMDIPVVKGRYYRADDVDNTFILLNGVLTDIGQQAFRKNKQMVELQEEVSQLRTDLSAAQSQLEIAQDVAPYIEEIDSLRRHVIKREDDLKRLAIASKQKIDKQDKQIAQLEQENDELGNLIEQLVHKIHVLEQKG